MNFEKGLLCTLTNEKANFGQTGCNDYQEDISEKAIQTEKLQQSINEKYSKASIKQDLLSIPKFKSYREFYVEDYKTTNSKIIIERDNTIYQIGSFTLPFLIGYTVYSHWNKLLNFEIGILTILFVMIIVNIILFKISFLKTLKNSSIEINSNFVCFTSYELLSNKKNESLIHWNNIFDFGIKTTYANQHSIERVVIFDKSGNEISLNGESFEMTNNKVVSIIKYGIDNYI